MLADPTRPTEKQHDTKTMKEMYTKPTIELENIWVEEGIAQTGVWDNINIEEGSSAGSLDENIW